MFQGRRISVRLERRRRPVQRDLQLLYHLWKLVQPFLRRVFVFLFQQFHNMLNHLSPVMHVFVALPITVQTSGEVMLLMVLPRSSSSGSARRVLRGLLRWARLLLWVLLRLLVVGAVRMVLLLLLARMVHLRVVLLLRVVHPGVMLWVLRLLVSGRVQGVVLIGRGRRSLVVPIARGYARRRDTPGAGRLRRHWEGGATRTHPRRLLPARRMGKGPIHRLLVVMLRWVSGRGRRPGTRH